MEDQFIEEVRKLKEQGLSERNIAGQMNVSRSKIRNALQAIRLEESGDDGLPEDKLRVIIREELERAHTASGEDSNEFPIVRKAGGGMELIAPEAVLKKYMGGTDEEALELKAIMKFRAAMLMVMDLVNIQKGTAEADAKRMEPILRLMQQTREEQDAAAARAKASSEEIAERAAQGVAGQLFGAVSQNNAQVSGSLDQLKQMITGQNNDPFSQVLSMMQSMQQLAGMFGMPMGGMFPGATPGINPTGSENAVEPPPIERHHINEWEGR